VTDPKYAAFTALALGIGLSADGRCVKGEISFNGEIC
jgi:hypothetical protein